MKLASRLTSSDSTFPNDPPKPMSCLCAHSPVTSERRKKTASSRNVLVQVTAKWAPLGWKSIWRTSPGSLKDAIAAEGSEDELSRGFEIRTHSRYPRPPPAVRLRHFCTRRLANLDPQVRRLKQLIHERDHLRRKNGIPT